MKISIKIFCLGILLLASLNCNDQNNKNTILIKGTIGNHFHLASTNNIEKDKRKEFFQETEAIKKKIRKLDKYYSYLNLGKKKEAKEIITTDSILSQSNEFGIAYGYAIIKMKELGILYSPLIQCHNFEETHLISISERDLLSLDKYLNKKIEVELKIEKIGYYEMDQTNIYKLVEIIKSEKNSKSH